MRATNCLLLLLVCAGVYICMAEEDPDYYSVLGISRDASAKQIKKAYRDLSLKFHPDKTGNTPEADKKWVGIQTAYDVLSDEDKRRKYDQFGIEGLQERQQHGGGFNPFDFLFNQGGSRGGGGHDNNMEKGETTTIPLEVTLEDLYLGRTLRVSHKKQVMCHKCRGSGAKDARDVKICPGCKGSGIKMKTQYGHGFIQQFQTTCDECNGKGKIVKSVCPHCSGTKVETAERPLTIIVERGMPDGHVIEGAERPETIPGDLAFKVVTERHKMFTRKGNDLYYHATITLLEALVGFKRELLHLDGHAVVIERSEVTPPGYVLTIHDEGMPVHTSPSQMGASVRFDNGQGNLFVDFTISFPPSLTAEQKQQLKKTLNQ